MESNNIGRRQLIKMSGALFVSLAAGQAFSAEDKTDKTEQVSPPEDLMREHGVLRRILLVYGYFLSRLNAKAGIPWAQIDESAALIRSFVEDYHERLEEQYVFPAVRKAGILEDLADVLLRQHRAGRKLTDLVSEIAKRKGAQASDRDRLMEALAQFTNMYRPHAAREDTVLFPQLHMVWPGNEFRRMGEVFEREEDRLFGEQGFEKVVQRVAAIEKKLGIYDINQFTPEGQL
jgi:hemerythrin-like domain-containing protein